MKRTTQDELRNKMIKLETKAAESYKSELKLEDIRYRLEYLIMNTRYLMSPENKETHTMEVVRKHNKRKKLIIEDTVQTLMNEQLFNTEGDR